MTGGKGVLLLLQSNVAVVDLEVPKEEETGMNIEVNTKNTTLTIIATTTQARKIEADTGEGCLN